MEHDSQKLELLAAMTQLLVNAKGLSAPETRESMEQACTLAEKVGNLPQLILQLFWIWLSVMAAGTPQSAAPIADEIWILSKRDASPVVLDLLAWLRPACASTRETSSGRKNISPAIPFTFRETS